MFLLGVKRISEVHQVLSLNNLRDKVILRTDGGLKTGKDVVIAAMLGTKKFFIEAEKNRVLKKPFRYSKPLVLIHGLKDNVVEEDVPRNILKKVTGKNVNIIYLKEMVMNQMF